MEVEDSDTGSHEGVLDVDEVATLPYFNKLGAYGSHGKPSEKLDLLKDMTYENGKHFWAITATAQGQSLAGSRRVVEGFGKAGGDEMTRFWASIFPSMKNNSHQISR